MANRRTTKPGKKAPTKDPKGRCGTYPGYAAHKRRGERPCKYCKEANTLYARKQRKGELGKQQRPTDVVQNQKRSGASTPPAPSLSVPLADMPTATAPKRADTPAVEMPPGAPSETPTDPGPVPAAPAYLKEQGRLLWERVNADYELNPAGLALLAEACRTVDRLERMAAALSSRTTLWFELEDSTEEIDEPKYTVVVNGMLGEARQLQNVLRSTLKTLGVTGVDLRASNDDAPRESLTDELKRKRAERLARAENETHKEGS
ncbi:terminase small subunit [Corynebacterium phage EmiRose]|uniref:Terminase small subunit n=1 Tax=Corynebacterium phage EmiRose TaxID=2565372 RepID=A0A649VPL6_9CAUD|nr:terminase small subunit [Corynebacterium phage EmiRose]QGJ94134.1 terminase small subunit [Corynebacterium phage EmiRose]